MNKERKKYLKPIKKELKNFHKLSLEEKEERYGCLAYAFLYQVVEAANETCRKSGIKEEKDRSKVAAEG